MQWCSKPRGTRGIEPETFQRRGQLLSRPPTTGLCVSLGQVAGRRLALPCCACCPLSGLHLCSPTLVRSTVQPLMLECMLPLAPPAYAGPAFTAAARRPRPCQVITAGRATPFASLCQCTCGRCGPVAFVCSVTLEVSVMPLTQTTISKVQLPDCSNQAYRTNLVGATMLCT